MKKKVIKLLILGCMMLGIMVGCSSNGNKNEVSSGQSNKGSSNSANITEEEKKKQDEIVQQQKYDSERKSSTDSTSQIPDEIVIKDKGFITDLDKIFDNVSAYEGKSITIEGFVRNVNGSNFSVLRYYDMPHEDHTDEVTVGINVTYDGEIPKDDDWVLVTGTIESEMYDGVKQPIIKASKVQKQFTWGNKKVTD